ncbi:MAG: hypothetical protein IJ334_04335, partial [Clostridia bacterium]|nr:hypothetical protein [Clostridia bacterium]
MTRKHLVKKCTAGLLVSCLLCGSLPMTVMAQETTLDKVIGTVDSTLGTATQSIYTYVVNNGTAALDDIQNYVTANFLADYPEAQAAFVEQIAEWKTNLTTAADNYAAVARKIADEIVDELEAFEAKYGDKIDDIIESVKEAIDYWMEENKPND